MNNKSLASTHKATKVADGIPMLIICAVIVAFLYIAGVSNIFSSNIMRYLLKIFLCYNVD